MLTPLLLTSKSPSYTTQNNFGIYIFQFRFPKQLKSLYPEIQSIFRRSLYTRCKREANSKARLWWLLMDELTRRMLVEPSIYGRAMGIAEEMAEIFSMLDTISILIQ